MKVYSLLIFLLAGIAITVTAQQQKELPPSLACPSLATLQAPPIQKLAVPFNVQKLREEDAELEGLGFPHRIAQIIPVALNPENAGEWTSLPNGQRIWRLELEAQGATAVSLLYDRFRIPRGGKLFIYNAGGNEVFCYTDRDNPKQEEYSTGYISGDKIRLEYAEPLSGGVSGETPQIQLSGLAYAYKDVMAFIAKQLLVPGYQEGDAAYCNININCPEGANWQDQKKSVVCYVSVVGGAQYTCSGAIVNNELQDLTPYLLTAFHCGEGATAADLNQWQFYFHYEFTGCDADSPLAGYKMLTGATQAVSLHINGESDGMLLKLNDPIPSDWDVYYSGWDRRDQTSPSGVSIHHPKGDVKKISVYTTPLATVTTNWDGGPGAPNAHWEATFAKGILEPGSSGAPLFNSNRRIIGTVSGGNPMMSCMLSALPTFHGKLSWHWDQSDNPEQHMSRYLDPNRTGIEYIDGTYGNDTQVAFLAGKKEIYAAETIPFFNRSRGDLDTWHWEFPGGTPATFEGENPPGILYNVPGEFTAKLTAKKGDQEIGVYEVPVRVTLKQNYCEKEPVSTGAGTETSPYPLGLGDGRFLMRQTVSIALYTAQELGLSAGSLITELEWDAKTAVRQTRILSVYLKETDDTQFTESSTWAQEVENATLVYRSPSNWTNTTGANKITLTTPFRSSGKNLKVLVGTVTSGASSSESAGCSYTLSENNLHQRWSATSSLSPDTRGTLDKNRPNLRFYAVEPCPTALPVANFSVSGTSIYEGDTIRFTDRSTGPSVVRTWTLPGGTPETSQQESLDVMYADEGVYDVGLWVKNTEGENTKNQTGAITVAARKPVAQFTATSAGFIKQAGGGQLLPVSGGDVQFEHLSLYKPRSLTWTFGGIDITSNEAMPVITYPAGENTYSVKLSAANSGGTDELLRTDYIQVGGTADIWNVRLGETADQVHTLGGEIANAVGSNATRLAEKYTAPEKGMISKVRVYTRNVTQNSQGAMTLAIYSDDNGLPNRSIASTLQIQGGNNRIEPDGYTTFTFPEPVQVSGTFYVVVGTTNYSHVSFTVPAVARREDIQQNTVIHFERFAALWVDLGQQGLATSLNIIPEFTYLKETGLADISVSDMLKVYPNPATQNHTFYVESGLDEAFLRDAQIRIYAIDGRLVHQQPATGKRTRLILSQPGTYLLQLNQERGMIVIR